MAIKRQKLDRKANLTLDGDRVIDIRDSEMMSIGTNCISSGKSMDGSTDVFWLHGTIYKTGIRPKKWLVPPVVAEAVKVLTRLPGFNPR